MKKNSAKMISCVENKNKMLKLFGRFVGNLCVNTTTPQHNSRAFFPFCSLSLSHRHTFDLSPNRLTCLIYDRFFFHSHNFILIFIIRAASAIVNTILLIRLFSLFTHAFSTVRLRIREHSVMCV